jgi:hypothetical protein
MNNNRAIQAYYSRTYNAINTRGAIGKPAAEDILPQIVANAEYRDNTILGRCCDAIVEVAPSGGGGGGGGDPIAVYTFMASAVLIPGAHPGLGTYFTYTGQVESVDWGDGTITTVGDTSPATQTLLHTYSLAAGYTITIKGLAGSLSGLSFYSAVQGSQVGVTGFNLAGSPGLTAFDCRLTGITSLAGISACPGLLTLLASGSAVTGTLTLTSPLIQTVSLTGCTALGGINATGVSALTTLDISGCSAMTAFTLNNSAIVALDFTGCTGLVGVNLDNNSVLVYLGVNEIPSPNLLSFTSVNCPVLAVLGFTANAALQVVTCDNCPSLSALLTLDYNTALLSVSAIGCSSLGAGGQTLAGCTGLTGLDMSGCTSLLFLDLTGCSSLNMMRVSGCATLANITMTGVDRIQQVYADGCALTQPTVDSILTQCVISENTYVSVSGTVDTSGGTSASPSLAGQADIVYLTNPPRSWTITTN